ncbi:MAG: CXXX repeat peptide maturase [Prevotella sp.]|nr:CXXX repeat peptide maturase [Prevotella sp.]
MLQYLIILLDDTSTSYCHYENIRTIHKLIPLDILKAGIKFGMMENLMIQFVYPDFELPVEYKEAIESIDHNNIVSSLCKDTDVLAVADVTVFHDWAGIVYANLDKEKCYALRTTKDDLFERFLFLKDVLSKVARLNVIITDIESFREEDFLRYNQVLHVLSEHVEKLYADDKMPQFNILTDRMMLSQMNNCGAAESNITLAPNGKFYVCPAFYYENESKNVGDLERGLEIKNKHLYKLDHAPICTNCDAYQCKRCIWLNRKTTLEVNTPSHEQCVVAHMERNASRELLQKMGKCKNPLWQDSIEEIDYLDPFEKYLKI